jgi:hypothetical protein
MRRKVSSEDPFFRYDFGGDPSSQEYRGCSLVKPSTIHELVEEFNTAVNAVETCYARLREAEADLEKVYSYQGSTNRIRIDACAGYGHGCDFSPAGAQRTIEKMQREAWWFIVERLEMRRVLSVQKTKELDEQLNKGELPPITYPNVEAFVQKYASDISSLIEDQIKEVFGFLRPRGGTRGGKYKTNPKFELKDRVILAYWVDDMTWSSRYQIAHNYQNEARALERVFQTLDGKGNVLKGYYSELDIAMREAPDGVGETDYFKFRACKNRNLHLQFKRMDLVKKLNMIAGGKSLKEASQ